jgi:hypothetical protein
MDSISVVQAEHALDAMRDDSGLWYWYHSHCDQQVFSSNGAAELCTGMYGVDVGVYKLPYSNWRIPVLIISTPYILPLPHRKGFSFGGIDTIANVIMPHIWKARTQVRIFGASAGEQTRDSPLHSFA